MPGGEAIASLIASLRVRAGPDLEKLMRLFETGAWSAERAETPGGSAEPERGDALALSHHRLQDAPDYRGALQADFAKLRNGGWLVIAVPRPAGDGAGSEPSLRPVARRTYSCESLLGEIGEALDPETYRVRLLCEQDVSADRPAEILCVLERIVAHTGLVGADAIIAHSPDRDFDPRRTRIESARTRPVDRVLILKLDHLGDFIMSLPALQKARETFADSRLTLVVGSWNESLARQWNIADEIIAFDAFPRNSSEENVELEGRTLLFRQAVPGSYDLAIDLRTDGDARFYLQHVTATVRAGLGTKARYPFLDIFLPIDMTRGEPESARQDSLPPSVFESQRFCSRNRFRIHCAAEDVTSNAGALIWGPYTWLRPGRYFFEPFVEFDDPRQGMLSVDVALNYERVIARVITAGSQLRLDFTVDEPDTKFEFRVQNPDAGTVGGFSFYGGRLVREGADSVLHQSEYQMLLVDLVAMRMLDHGLLSEIGDPG